MKTLKHSILVLLFFSLAFLGESFEKMPMHIVAQAKTKPTKEKTFRADFRNQNIQDFLKAMSAVVGKNIIIDDRVQGNITVISPNRIPVSQAYNYLLSVLSMRGMSVVEENNALKVLPIREAIARDQTIHFGREPLPMQEASSSVITHIVPLLGSRPSQLAPLLKQVTGGNTEVIPLDDNEMIVMIGEMVEVNRLVTILDMIDKEKLVATESESYGDIHILRLEHMQADVMEQTLRKIQLPDKSFPVPPGQPVPKKPIEIYGFKETNSLVFVGSNELFLPVKALIQKIDTAREQVLLEVLIAEVSADSANSYGIDWSFTGPAGNAQLNTGTLANSGLISKSTGMINPAGVNTLLGFSLGFLQHGKGIAALVNANINKKGFTVLSAPQILTLNNQEAEINVGQDVPVVTGQLANTDGTARSTTVEYRPTGVKLKFTPNINNGRMVTLNIFGEIKEIAGSSTIYDNPQFNKRDIKTVVRVNNNQTLVIGGLVSSNKETKVYKIPVLGDIPLLGYLFKRVERSTKKKNLLFFITPHIINNQMLADRYTEDMIQKLYEASKEATERDEIFPLKEKTETKNK